MGLLNIFKKKVSEEELAAREENKAILEQFTPTKAWGIKKHATAMQFIYDEKMEAFVVVSGPAETFKERNPYVIRFDEVTDIWLEVDEWWTEDDEKFSLRGSGNLTIDRFDEVFWRYDFYLNIITTHPFCEKIRYKMNFNTTITPVLGFHIFARRGLEINGIYRGKEITKEVEQLEEYLEQSGKFLKTEKIYDIITRQRPDSIIGRLKKDMTNDWYLSRIENVINHLKRAARISKLLGHY